MNKLKIFVSAYACEPGLGSEIGVGWHWVLEMSQYFELWVLTRESNRHTIEPWITAHPEYSGIHFLYYDWPKWARFWKKGLRGVRTYYNIWQYCTNDIVKQTMQENDIHIFHHLTYGNVLWKVSKYGQTQFFIWGPVGGLESIPKEFTCYYGFKSKCIESLRRCVIRLLPLNKGFKTRCRNADLILCKTDITRNCIPATYREKAVLQTDVAVELCDIQEPVTDSHLTAEFITIGRLDGWRGFDLCIESVAKAVKVRSDIHLTIVGDGTDKLRLKRLAGKHGISDKVTFAGKVSMEEYKLLLNNADVVMNAALKEGAVTVSFDSMSMGKPLICLNSTGYTRYFSDEYAVIIPIGKREQVIDDLTDGILKMCVPATHKRMGESARAAGKHFTWAAHGEDIYRLFTERMKGKC